MKPNTADNERCATIPAKITVPLVDLASLRAARPTSLPAGDPGQTLGVFAFAPEAHEPGGDLSARMFFDAFGIREDPVTGSASGPLAEYLARHGVIALGNGPVRVRAEQGDAMGKPGRLDLEVAGAAGKVDSVRVGGAAVTVLEGSLKV